MLTRNKIVKSTMVLSQEVQNILEKVQNILEEMVRAEEIYGYWVETSCSAELHGGVSPEYLAGAESAKNALVKVRLQFEMVVSQSIEELEACIARVPELMEKHSTRCEESDRRVAELISELPPTAETSDALEVFEETPLECKWRNQRLSIKRAKVAARKSYELMKEFETQVDELLKELEELNTLRTVWSPPPPQRPARAENSA
jgi:hypothetical protein